LLQAEQGLAAVALHAADLHKQVTQQQSELRAVERQRRIEAALASQMPRLQHWQSTQVSLCILLDMRREAWQQHLSCLPIASCSTCSYHVPSSYEEISRLVLTIKHGLSDLLLAFVVSHCWRMACIISSARSAGWLAVQGPQQVAVCRLISRKAYQLCSQL